MKSLVGIAMLSGFAAASMFAGPQPTGVQLPQPLPLGSGGVFVFGAAPDANTKTPISTIYMAVASTPGAEDQCYLSYWPSQNLIYVVGPPSEPVQWVTPGLPGTAQNSRCSVSGLSSTATVSTDGEVNVNVALNFKNAHPSGTKPTWSAAIDTFGNNSGWMQHTGQDYCIRTCSTLPPAPPNQPPFPQPFSPSGRTGTFESFDLVISDGNGASDVTTMQMLINSGLTSSGACNFTVDSQAAGATGVLYLVNDPGNGQPVTIQGLQPGTSGTAGNSRCSLRGTDLKLTRSGNQLTVKVGITLFAAGSKQIFIAAQDQSGGNSGWKMSGSWAAPTAQQQVSLLNPGCGNAAGCTEYFFRLTSNDPLAPRTSGAISLTSRGVAPTSYTGVLVDYYRTATCPSNSEGEMLPSSGGGRPPDPPGSLNIGSMYRMLENDFAYLILQKQLAQGPTTIPAYYFARAEFWARATWSGQNIDKKFYLISNCIRIGDVPQPQLVENTLSGLFGAVDRGTTGPHLRVFGLSLAGVTGTAIQSSNGIPTWSIADVSPTGAMVLIDVQVNDTAVTGNRVFTLSNGLLTSVPVSLAITDPTPKITDVSPDRIWLPGEMITVTLTGEGFGSQPLVTLIAQGQVDVNTCLGSEQVNLLAASDGSITFSKYVPDTSPGCQFGILVTSRGISGNSFYGQASPQRQSVLRTASVGEASNVPPTKIFIVHGLDDSSSSMAGIRNSLVFSVPIPTKSNGGFEVNASFQYSSNRSILCDPLGTAADSLASYIRANTTAQQRVVLIGHSMGGLVIRKMLTASTSVSWRFLNSGPDARRIVGLATLGTPHLGYPYTAIDEDYKCGIHVRDMDSFFDDRGANR